MNEPRIDEIVLGAVLAVGGVEVAGGAGGGTGRGGGGVTGCGAGAAIGVGAGIGAGAFAADFGAGFFAFAAEALRAGFFAFAVAVLRADVFALRPRALLAEVLLLEVLLLEVLRSPPLFNFDVFLATLLRPFVFFLPRVFFDFLLAFLAMISSALASFMFGRPLDVHRTPP